MSARVVIRPKARADIDETAEYIARENAGAGIRFLTAIEETFKQLVDTPGLGRVRMYLDPRLKGLRSWRIGGFENWLAFYKPIDDEIEVVRVLHGARDLEPIFAEDE